LLRSELLSIEQLKRHAVTLAGQHRIDPRPGPDRLLPRLAENERVLLAAYDVVTATPQRHRGNGSCRPRPGCSTTST
jgi:cyclic beta-1,2-glucan synthetase